jgi:hypothetical protein
MLFLWEALYLYSLLLIEVIIRFRFCGFSCSFINNCLLLFFFFLRLTGSLSLNWFLGCNFYWLSRRSTELLLRFLMTMLYHLFKEMVWRRLFVLLTGSTFRVHLILYRPSHSWWLLVVLAHVSLDELLF